ncbi:MAG: hypothetical protein K0R84_1458, partial [Clostridia bacterium]|nr:hypothetical protein [Clostridia bacterium]
GNISIDNSSVKSFSVLDAVTRITGDNDYIYAYRKHTSIGRYYIDKCDKATFTVQQTIELPTTLADCVLLEIYNNKLYIISSNGLYEIRSILNLSLVKTGSIVVNAEWQICLDKTDGSIYSSGYNSGYTLYKYDENANLVTSVVVDSSTMIAGVSVNADYVIVAFGSTSCFIKFYAKDDLALITSKYGAGDYIQAVFGHGLSGSNAAVLRRYDMLFYYATLTTLNIKINNSQYFQAYNRTGQQTIVFSGYYADGTGGTSESRQMIFVIDLVTKNLLFTKLITGSGSIYADYVDMEKGDIYYTKGNYFYKEKLQYVKI